MKKLITLKVAMTLMLFMAGFNQVSARWVGNSAINVNGTWYYAGSNLDWCGGGAFNGKALGTVESLTIGGQSQVYTADGNAGNWGEGTMIMGYRIDDGANQTVTLTWYEHSDNNNFLQSGGKSFTSEVIDISNLSAGTHYLRVWFVSEDTYDSNNSNNYVANFIIPENKSVTVGSDGYATFVSPYRLDYTLSSIKAYTAKVNESTGVVTLTQINKVRGGVPVVLYKEGGDTEDVPVASSIDPVGGNDLKAGTGAEVATFEVISETTYYNYILNNASGIGFYKANAQTVESNRAYLQTTYNVAAPGAARMTMVFADDEITGIAEHVIKADNNNRYFDMQGRSVAQPKNGLYIMNGKKVIIK